MSNTKVKVRLDLGVSLKQANLCKSQERRIVTHIGPFGVG
jgi:hypothetical protein